MSRPRKNWPDAKLAVMRRLAEEGRSAADVADYFGVSRNSVLGAGHRHGIRFRRYLPEAPPEMLPEGWQPSGIESVPLRVSEFGAPVSVPRLRFIEAAQ